MRRWVPFSFLLFMLVANTSIASADPITSPALAGASGRESSLYLASLVAVPFVTGVVGLAGLAKLARSKASDAPGRGDASGATGV